jgi:hypothetical protein
MTAKGNVLPVRHVLVLQEKSTSSANADDFEPGKQQIPILARHFKKYAATILADCQDPVGDHARAADLAVISSN